MRTLKIMYCADFFILTLAHIPMMCTLLFYKILMAKAVGEKIMPGK